MRRVTTLVRWLRKNWTIFISRPLCVPRRHIQELQYSILLGILTHSTVLNLNSYFHAPSPRTIGPRKLEEGINFRVPHKLKWYILENRSLHPSLSTARIEIHNPIARRNIKTSCFVTKTPLSSCPVPKPSSLSPSRPISNASTRSRILAPSQSPSWVVQKTRLIPTECMAATQR